MALARYDPTKPIQLLIFNSSPTLVGALYQPQGVLEWLHNPMGGTPQIFNEVDAFASMIKNGRDTAVQTLGKRTWHSCHPLLPLWHSVDYQKSLLLCYQLNRIPRTNWQPLSWREMGLCPPSVVMVAPKLFSKGPIAGASSIFTDGGKRGLQQ